VTERNPQTTAVLESLTLLKIYSNILNIDIHVKNTKWIYKWTVMHRPNFWS
jgi:hypothetical protein